MNALEDHVFDRKGYLGFGLKYHPSILELFLNKSFTNANEINVLTLALEEW